MTLPWGDEKRQGRAQVRRGECSQSAHAQLPPLTQRAERQVVSCLSPSPAETPRALPAGGSVLTASAQAEWHDGWAAWLQN